ncbi:pentapeptide repeat-containing protein [Nostoc parmelioides]|uniref:Pentapeptide repeat-containing protein n=1 Tax=Nostoc parmelioides FACHB-3921 TaxID=2692909 RepID=A0ABR8BGF9_9NOSO|nr:pentapeptide repeat-containing protein [Nostoc parmelioides]MBD2251801.1 pentapeptide repeat-containing protein [Nostoc parmelioides FACHB-3921]
MKPEIVDRRIALFEKNFGKPHLYLAYHAAFPLALTPELIYRLWANFQRDIHGQSLNIPWVAVGDFLLSSLCEEVGHELYEINMSVRNELLRKLKAEPKFGIERINQLSDFLLEYVRQQILSDDPDTQNFAKTLQWTALAYTKPTEVARQIALTFRHLEILSVRSDRLNHTELVRMASLVETFAEPLAEAQLAPLVTYARGMARFAHGDLEGATAQIGTVAEAGKIQVAGVDIPIPEKIQENLDDASPPEGLDFRGQNLRGRSFRGQNLARANFSRSDIRSVDFSNAILTGANFRYAQAGLQSYWAVGLMLCAFLLSALSGMASGFAGWIWGWEFNAGGSAMAIGIASLIALVVVFVVTFRRGIDNRSGAFALSVMGTTAIASFEFLSLYAVLPEVVRSGNPILQAIAFAIPIALGLASSAMSDRWQIRTLPITLIALAGGTGLGIISSVWFWLLQNPTIQIALATLAVNLVIAGSGAIAIVKSAAWMRNGATLGSVAATFLLTSLWLINLLSSLDITWITAVLAGIIALALSWASVITLALAVNLVTAEIEHRIFARAWILAAFLLGILILSSILILGGLRIYPPFKVIEDVPMIIITIIVIAVLAMIIVQLSLDSNTRFTAIGKFVSLLPTTAGTSFHGADLANADFTQAIVRSVDFRGANISQTCWVHTKRLDYASTEGTYLVNPQVRQLVINKIGNNQKFDYLDLQGINLDGANLADASFIGTNLRAANLRNADLSRTKLIDTILDQADLTGAFLTGAYLQNSKITNLTRLENVVCSYIFTRLPSTKNPNPARQPEELEKNFTSEEFTIFIQSLINHENSPSA